MVSFYHWKQGKRNRNYYILHELERRNEVNKILSCDFLPHSLKRGLSVFLREKRFTGGKILKSDLFSRLTQISSKLFTCSSLLPLFSEERLYKYLDKILAQLDMRDNLIVWSYYPIRIGYFYNRFYQKINVFDAVDQWCFYPGLEKISDRIGNNYKKIDRQANIIFTVSKRHLEFFNNKNTYWIPNGLDLSRYQEIKEFKVPKELQGMRKPIIGYVGTLNKRLDLDILQQILCDHPNKQLVLIGPIWKDIRYELEKLSSSFKNLYLLGEKPYWFVPHYIHAFDICIIPHRRDMFLPYTDSTKLYEFLYLGKKIVTTSAPFSKMEYCVKKGLIKVADEKHEFSQTIELVMKENHHLEKERTKLARQCSWKNRVDKMWKVIDTYV